ncbi:MAG: hypothetical protein P8M02_04375 [Flavobacteriaceae bacterium]|jgi:uncharacterized protein YqgV (UPF0045/DUF77 family)|nr:hypothetical protein [Flavobacteriaceae bacterium]MDG2386633.1 hypothetical protein [Flavobacteriaceae bacterium]
MKISVELTLAPLKSSYIPSIKNFIMGLRNTGFRVIENPLSTQVFGDYDEIMTSLVPLIKSTFEDEEAIMLHLKLVKGDRSNYEPDF